jgi:hypothetical protein
VHYDNRTGSLFIRSSWEDDATWLGYFGGSGQLFRNGRVEPLRLKQMTEIGTEMVVPGDRSLTRFQVEHETPDRWFIIGLKPLTTYDIETAEESMFEAKTDAGGILVLEFKRKGGQSVFVHEPRKAAPVVP